MKKKHLSLCFSAALLLMVSTSLLANPKIAKVPAHKGKTCAFCHDQAQFPRKKAGYDEAGPKYKEIAKNKLCAGPQCHQ